MVTFSFEQRANMELDIYNMFIQGKANMVCMTLLDAGSLGLSIIGVSAHRTTVLRRISLLQALFQEGRL